MKKITLFLLLILSFGQQSLFAQEPLVKVTYECFDLKGNKRWNATVQLEKSTGKNKISRLVERGAGRYGDFEYEIDWTAILEFRSTEDSLVPLLGYRNFYDKQGELIAREEQRYDHKENKVFFSKKDLIKNTKIEKEFRFKGDIVDRMLIEFYIQKFLKNGETRRRVNMLTTAPQLYNLTIRTVGETNVEYNGKEVKALKLCLDPNLGILNFIKIILPKAYTWHAAEKNFEWIKYIGLESSSSSPKVEIKMVETIIQEGEWQL